MSPDRVLAAASAASAAHAADPFGDSGAHLAGYSFRFDTAAAAELDLEPHVPTWTLDGTLGEIVRRGARLRVGSGGVRLAHAHRMPDVARAVARHAAALALYVSLGLDRDAPDRLGARYVPFGADAWDEATRFRAAWFARRFAMSERLQLRPGVVVIDAQAFRDSVARRLALGPDAPGADGLRADLEALFDRHAIAPVAVEPPAYARAA